MWEADQCNNIINEHNKRNKKQKMHGEEERGRTSWWRQIDGQTSLVRNSLFFAFHQPSSPTDDEQRRTQKMHAAHSLAFNQNQKPWSLPPPTTIIIFSTTRTVSPPTKASVSMTTAATSHSLPTIIEACTRHTCIITLSSNCSTTAMVEAASDNNNTTLHIPSSSNNSTISTRSSLHHSRITAIPIIAIMHIIIHPISNPIIIMLLLPP